MITSEDIVSVEFYKNFYFGRVVCLSKENNCVLMLETAWDRYLMKVFDPEIEEHGREISEMQNLADSRLIKWKRLGSSYAYYYFQDIISALNYTVEINKGDVSNFSANKYCEIVKAITNISRPQWERWKNEPIPSPIPHPDVKGVDGPPRPEGTIL